MKKIRIIPILLVICMAFAFAAPCASAEVKEPMLKSSDAYLLIDMESGHILLEKEPYTNHSIASLTKIMTVLLAVEAVEDGRVNLTDMVTATEHVRDGLDTSSSNAGIVQGETMTYEDLLYCALVHSANDACNVLAEYIEGSIGNFVAKMNQKAAELGCTNTQFNDVCGMFNRSDGHYSCPYDLYIITKEAMNHPLFLKICNTVDYTVAASNVREAWDIHNSNALISSEGLYGSGYLYEGTIGVKTGFTKPAGYCLVSTCKKNDMYLMAVVLGCNGPLTYTSVPGEYQNFLDSATLYDWGFKNYAPRTIFLAGERLKRFPVQYAKDGETVAVAPTSSLSAIIGNDVLDSEIVYTFNVDEDKLVAPIAAGDEMGSVDVFIAGEKYASVTLKADTDVEIVKSMKVKSDVKNFFHSKGLKIFLWCLVGLAAAFVVYRFVLAGLKTARRRQVNEKIHAREREKYYRGREVISAREAEPDDYNFYHEEESERPKKTNFHTPVQSYSRDTGDEVRRPSQPQPRRPQSAPANMPDERRFYYSNEPAAQKPASSNANYGNYAGQSNARPSVERTPVSREAANAERPSRPAQQSPARPAQPSYSSAASAQRPSASTQRHAAPAQTQRPAAPTQTQRPAAPTQAQRPATPTQTQRPAAAAPAAKPAAPAPQTKPEASADEYDIDAILRSFGVDPDQFN